MDPAVQHDPFATDAEMHERCPVYRLPEIGLVMVTNYDDVRTVMTGSSVFSGQPSGGAGRHTDVGNHFCIGAALARQELFSVFQAVVARMDDLALAEPLDEQPHEFNFFLRPMKQLQLSFSAKGGPP